MTPLCRRLRVVVGVSVAVFVVLAGWGGRADGVVAGQSPAGTPPLKLLVADGAIEAVPDRLVIGLDAINNAGDWVNAAGGGSALFLRRAGDATLTRLLQSGDPVPGLPLSAANTVRDLRMNQPGIVCALVDVQARGITGNAIVTYQGTTLRKVVASSDTAPGPSGSVFGRYINLAGINDAGDVAFTAPMVPLGWPPGAPTFYTIFIAPTGVGPVRIVGPGDPVPESPGRTLDQISGVQFNNRGEVLFRATIAGGTGATGYFIARRDDAGAVAVRKIVATGDDDLRGGTFDAALATNGVRLNNAGQVAMVIAGRGLYTSSPDTGLALVAEPGEAMPAPLSGKSLQSFATLTAASFNDAGSVAFAATVTGLLGSPNAVLRYEAGTGALEVLGYHGQAAPGTTGQMFHHFSNVLTNNTGHVSFYGTLMPNTGPTGGLFKVSGGTVTPVVLNGHDAPASVGGVYVNTSYSHLLDNGSVHFESELRGSRAHYGAFLVTASELRVLASNGDPVPSGSRVVMMNLFMGGAGTYTLFAARRTGAGNSLWTHNAATGVTSKVIAVGDSAPVDGGGVLSSVGTSNQGMTGTGDVIVPGSVWGSSGTFLFSWSPSGGVSRLVGPGDVLPGTGAVFTSCALPGLLVAPFNDDAVVFRGNLGDGSNGIFVVPKAGGSVSKVVLSTDTAPTGGTFTDPSGTTTLNYPYINGAGQVAFWAPTSAGKSGIFIGTGGSPPVKVAATGDPSPGGGTFSAFTLAGPAGFNDLGQVVFFATVAGGPRGFFMGTAAGSVQAIAVSGQSAPDGSTYAFAADTKDALANARGDILFKAPLAGGAFNSGLFLRRAGTSAIETVAVAGQMAPERPFPFHSFGVTLNNYPGENLALGPSGEVLFGTDLDLGDQYVWGLFRYNGPGTLETVFVRGEPLPGAPDEAIAYYSQKPGTGGEGLFFLALRTVSLDGDSRDAIYLLDTRPPTLSISVDPPVLWPPDGKLRPVTFTGQATDNGSGVAGTQGTYTVVDEYGLVQPTGTFPIDRSGSFSFDVPLEARRLGTDRDGRWYVVQVTVRDVAGNATTASVSIVVPFSQGR